MKKLHMRSRASFVQYAGVVIDRFPVKAMPLDDLYCPVRPVQSFVDEVRESIGDTGLLNPVIVVRKPREDIVDYFKETKGGLKSGSDSGSIIPVGFPDGPVVNMVWGGTNRVYAVRELGYTHIDCVLVPDFALAYLVQERQRNSYVDARKLGTA
jgi:hypothetical protein